MMMGVFERDQAAAGRQTAVFQLRAIWLRLAQLSWYSRIHSGAVMSAVRGGRTYAPGASAVLCSLMLLASPAGSRRSP